jgi:uncharacterized membrane protein YdbT with pleckstrin-like domain
MPDLTIQPSRKWIRFEYTTATIVLCAAVFVYVNYYPDKPAWLLVLPALLYLYPVWGDVRRRFTKITLDGDKLHYEIGILSKTLRTVQLSKIQDVTVTQSLGQRLMRMGTLSFETAGETSRLTIRDIDDPREAADQILDAAQGRAPKARKGGKA